MFPLPQLKVCSIPCLSWLSISTLPLLVVEAQGAKCPIFISPESKSPIRPLGSLPNPSHVSLLALHGAQVHSMGVDVHAD